MMYAARLFLFGLASMAVAKPAPRPCPPFSGNFTIEAQALYPENMDFDTIHCKLYTGVNYNASVLVYDPYTAAKTVLTWPGISYNHSFHLSGVDFNKDNGMMYFTANAGLPWETNGQNLTGPNFLIAYSTYTNRTVYIADLNPALAKAKTFAGRAIGGLQDQAEDGAGNSYVVASYGGAVLKVTPAGNPSLYYVGSNTSAYSIGGITAVSSKKLVFFNSESNQLLSFDTSRPVNPNTGVLAVATPIPVLNLPNFGLPMDGMIAPAKYCNEVLLMSNDLQSTIVVMRSTNGWNTGEYLGSITNNFVPGGWATAQVEIGGSIYINEEFFFDPGLFERTANRTSFPFIDITAQVAALVGH